MTQLQIGAELIQTYSETLSRQLRKMAERYALDTVETEELIHWVSTVMATPIQSIYQAQEMLMSGSKALSLTMSKPGLEEGILIAILQAQPGVRYATISKKPGKPAKVTAYMARVVKP